MEGAEGRWLYVVTGCAGAPKLQEPVKDCFLWREDSEYDGGSGAPAIEMDSRFRENDGSFNPTPIGRHRVSPLSQGQAPRPPDVIPAEAGIQGP